MERLGGLRATLAAGRGRGRLGRAGAVTTSPASSSSRAVAAVLPTWSMRTMRFSPTLPAAPAIEIM